MAEENGPPKQGDFEKQLEKTVRETEEAVLGIQDVSTNPKLAKSWSRTADLVADFQPAPWFIWRLVNFVLGRSEQTATVAEGLVFGLRRMLFAAAADPQFGNGEKATSVRKALKVVDSDVIAATALILAVSRRLSAKKELERIWRPILDDALLRTRIGFLVGFCDDEFGAGRGMLAGFSGRAGLAVLVAVGDESQGRNALELMASGTSVREVGLEVYDCEPAQVSAMILSAGGLSRDAAFGTASYATREPLENVKNDHQLKWLAAYTICDRVRTGAFDDVAEEMWEALMIESVDRETLRDEVRKYIRRGHGLNWIL